MGRPNKQRVGLRKAALARARKRAVDEHIIELNRSVEEFMNDPSSANSLMVSYRLNKLQDAFKIKDFESW